MSKSDRNGDITRGLIVGFLAGVLFIVMSFGLSSSPVDVVAHAISDCSADTNNCANNGEQLPDRWVFWKLTFLVEDTIAQWVMMLFTIIAAFLLLWNLDATRGMAVDQKRIGEAQTRAYLSVVGGKFWTDDSNRPCFQLEIKNSGNSPAIKITDNITILDGKTAAITDGIIQKEFKRKDFFVTDMGGGEAISHKTHADGKVTGDPDWMMSALLKISYQTVFSPKQLDVFFLVLFMPEFDWPSADDPIDLAINTLLRGDIENYES